MVETRGPTRADPSLVAIEYYKIRANQAFQAFNVFFRPGVDFLVTPAIYNSTLEDGITFRDKCVSATPEPRLAP